MKDMCDGCFTDITTCPVKNFIDVYHYKNKCPCINCLVKSMCIKICIERSRYSSKLGKDKYEEEELRI